MSQETIRTLIIAIGLLLAVGLALWIFRGSLKKGSIKAFGVTAGVETHGPEHTVVKNIEQIAKRGDSKVRVRSTNATVDGVKQTSLGNNDLDVGNP